MRDLTRTPTLSPRGSYEEVKRWVDTVAVRGNFDWMPGVCGYTTTSLVVVPYELLATNTDLLKFSFTPRVRCRIIALFQPVFDVTVASPAIVAGVYTSPAALPSSFTDPTAVTPNDYGVFSLGTGVVGGRMTRVVVNSFDLAPGVTYEIIGQAKIAVAGTARFRTPSMLTAIHFPLLTPAGQ